MRKVWTCSGASGGDVPGGLFGKLTGAEGEAAPYSHRNRPELLESSACRLTPGGSLSVFACARSVAQGGMAAGSANAPSDAPVEMGPRQPLTQYCRFYWTSCCGSPTCSCLRCCSNFRPGLRGSSPHTRRPRVGTRDSPSAGARASGPLWTAIPFRLPPCFPSLNVAAQPKRTGCPRAGPHSTILRLPYSSRNRALLQGHWRGSSAKCALTGLFSM